MFYIDSLQSDFEIILTLGAEDTNNAPPLALGFYRYGTNESIIYEVSAVDVTESNLNIKIENIPTNIFSGSGQYDYIVYDNTDPLNREEIEKGICIVTIGEITKNAYGTDKERGEFK
jgi:hypothetical protein